MTIKKPTVVDADTEKLLVDLQAYELTGWRAHSGHTHQVVVKGYKTANFTLGKNYSATLRNLLDEVYTAGIEEGTVQGRRNARDAMRRALGLEEIRTDGHARTIVVED